jgi:hypothetical protein
VDSRRVRDETPASWPLLVLSVVVIFLLLHGSATALGSLRGEAGIAVGVLVVAACLIAQRVLWGMPISVATQAIGLGRPAAKSLWAAAGVGAILLLTLPVFAITTGAHLTMYPGWLLLLPGRAGPLPPPRPRLPFSHRFPLHGCSNSAPELSGRRPSSTSPCRVASKWWKCPARQPPTR